MRKRLGVLARSPSYLRGLVSGYSRRFRRLGRLVGSIVVAHLSKDTRRGRRECQTREEGKVGCDKQTETLGEDFEVSRIRGRQEGLGMDLDDERGVWLVKLPGFLHAHLSAAAEAGQQLDVGWLELGASGEPAEGMRLALVPHPALEGKPGALSTRARPLEQQLKAYKEDSQGTLKMVGSVAFRGDMVPVAGAEYASMINSKLIKSEVKSSATVVQKGGRRAVDEKKELYKRRRAEIEEERVAEPAQRIELTRKEMVRRSCVFRVLSNSHSSRFSKVTAVLTLFEEEDSWAKRDIVRRTNQDEKLISSVVKELCMPNTSPEHRNEYILREEFKIQRAPKKQKQ